MAERYTVLKERLRSLGLLTLARGLNRRFGPDGLVQLWLAFRFYLYNKWLSNFPSAHVRLAYLRHILGLSIGSRVFVHMGCFFEGRNISIGENSVIGRHCYLGGTGGSLTIGRNVSITARSYLFCSTHVTNSPIFETTIGDINIGDRVWIGVSAIILPGVDLGEGAVVGASAVVTKSVPAFTIWAGVPAKQIGVRNSELTYELDYWPLLH